MNKKSILILGKTEENNYYEIIIKDENNNIIIQTNALNKFSLFSFLRDWLKNINFDNKL